MMYSNLVWKVEVRPILTNFLNFNQVNLPPENDNDKLKQDNVKLRNMLDKDREINFLPGQRKVHLNRLYQHLYL